MKTSKSLKRAAVAAACMSLLPVLVASAGAQPAAPDEVVARLGASEVRLSELRTLLEQAADGRPRPLPSAEQLDRVARTEVFRRAVLAEAKAQGWDRRSEVQQQMERAREQVLVAAYMNSVVRPAADYPSEEELQAFYKAAEGSLAVPRQFQLAQVFIADAKGESKRKAEEVAARARARQADFAAIARAESQHQPSAKQGGSLGWVAETELLPELRTVVASAGKGDVLGPVRTAQGWHVVKVLDLRAARTRALAEVRDELVAAMRQRKAQDNERRYLDELAAKQSLAVDQDALARLAGPGGPAQGAAGASGQ